MSSTRYNYEPRDRSAELPKYSTDPAARAAYRKAVREQQARDRAARSKA
jgi:hypothetical protein